MRRAHRIGAPCGLWSGARRAAVGWPWHDCTEESPLGLAPAGVGSLTAEGCTRWRSGPRAGASGGGAARSARMSGWTAARGERCRLVEGSSGLQCGRPVWLSIEMLPHAARGGARALRWAALAQVACDPAVRGAPARALAAALRALTVPRSRMSPEPDFLASIPLGACTYRRSRRMQISASARVQKAR